MPDPIVSTGTDSATAPDQQRDRERHEHRQINKRFNCLDNDSSAPLGRVFGLLFAAFSHRDQSCLIHLS